MRHLRGCSQADTRTCIWHHGGDFAQVTTPRRKPLYIPDDFGWDIDLFSIPSHYKPYVSKVMLPRGMIKDRVARLARDIRDDYGKTCPHLLCVLKGAHAFFADLSKALNRHHEFSSEVDPAFTFDFVRVKSYEGDHSTGSGECHRGHCVRLPPYKVVVCATCSQN